MPSRLHRFGFLQLCCEVADQAERHAVLMNRDAAHRTCGSIYSRESKLPQAPSESEPCASGRSLRYGGPYSNSMSLNPQGNLPLPVSLCEVSY